MARAIYDMNTLVPIPEGAHICKDHRVYIVKEARYYEELQYNMDEKLWIGKAVSEKEMYPSQFYAVAFPNGLKNIVHLNLPIYHKPVGMYAVTLVLSEKNGLYQDLVTCLGPQSANLVMDYAMYSIITKSNVAKDLEATMRRHMLFLGKAYSDTWIGERLDNGITDDHIQAFKDTWTKRFAGETLSGIWVCTDGSNNDCNANVPEAEKGKAKTHKNTNIVGFLYAVTEDGTPVRSDVYRGSKVDSKALLRMVHDLSGFELKPKGFILDRGFCNAPDINSLRSSRYDFVIKLKEKTAGFADLMSEFRDKIKYKWKYAIGNRMYGAGKKVKIFSSNSIQAHCVLLWDSKNAGLRTDYFVDGLLDTIADAEDALAEGKTPSIPEKYKAYIKIKTIDGKMELDIRESLIQKEMDDKGFSGLICSKEYSAREADTIYNYRDSSETQYAIMKTQLGCSVFRVREWHRIKAREMIAFVASIIRNEMLKRCRTEKYDLNQAIKELEQIVMSRNANSAYEVLYEELSERQRKILDIFDVSKKTLSNIAAYETNRANGDAAHPIQSTNEENTEENKNPVPKVRIKGIPEGSRAKGKGSRSESMQQNESDKPENTSETEHVTVHESDPEIQKHTSTDSISSEDNKTAATEQSVGSPQAGKSNDDDAKPPKRRGRPPGSKNKPKESKNPQ